MLLSEQAMGNPHGVPAGTMLVTPGLGSVR